MNKHIERHHSLSDCEIACWVAYVDLLTFRCGVKRLSLNAQMWVI